MRILTTVARGARCAPISTVLLSLACSASFSVPTILAGSQEKEDVSNPAVAKELIVNGGQLVLAFRTETSGLVLARIGNRTQGVEHLPHPSQVFGVACGAGGEWLKSDEDFIIDGESHANDCVLKLSFRNTGKTKMSCRIRAPWIQGLATKSQGQAMRVALPQEVGGVVSTEKSPVGSGPIQFTFIWDTVTGYSLMDLNPGESRTLPAFAIGVHQTGDWHYPVDDYCNRHRTHWKFPDTPTWFREQGALYSFSGSGGGAIYMEYPQQDLKSRIGSFEQLPSLLDEALSLGTNIVYLCDYWQGATKGGRPQYWNKGDYTPRSDLGGEKAFRQGIRQIHERGGRVILYVEPFNAFWYSHVGEHKGQQWAGRDVNGTLYHQYPQNYTMVSCFRPWQEYVVNISTGLVRDFDVDGIFLDSRGWQINWLMQTAEEKILYTPLQYSLGVLDESVTAYCYRGARNEIVTVCNHGSRGYDGKLILDASARSSQWEDLLKPNALRSSDTSLSVKIPAGDLSIMARRGAERTN